MHEKYYLMRLMTGDDVVCQAEKIDNGYKLINPLKLSYVITSSKKASLMLTPWVQVAIDTDQIFDVSNEKIIFIKQSDINLTEFYLETMNTFNKEKELNEKYLNDEMTDVEEFNVTEDDFISSIFNKRKLN